MKKLNNDAREHELHITRQGLSNKSTGHDVERVLEVCSQSLVRKFQILQISLNITLVS